MSDNEFRYGVRKKDAKSVDKVRKSPSVKVIVKCIPNAKPPSTSTGSVSWCRTKLEEH